MSLEGFHALAERLGQPAYRAKQLYQWVFQHGVRSIAEMTNLPAALRQRLVEEGYTVGRMTRDHVSTSVDGTRKIVYRLDDGAAVESVLIPMEEGKFTQCLSSQVGCALDCKFCYTGTMGLSRHLSPGEIVDQVLLARDVVPEGASVTNLVYMGMGEPLHNYDNVISSLGHICNDSGLGYSYRRVTVSTSGLVPAIGRLGRDVPVNLAISLNASSDEIRDQIMPINRRYNLESLIGALREYPLPPRRKMTIEYVLLGGVNDSREDAIRLARLLRGLPVRINLLPWNPFQGPGYERPETEAVEAFQRILKDSRYTVTVRTTKGLDIDAACGQLGERPDMDIVQIGEERTR